MYYVCIHTKIKSKFIFSCSVDFFSEICQIFPYLQLPTYYYAAFFTFFYFFMGSECVSVWADFANWVSCVGIRGNRAGLSLQLYDQANMFERCLRYFLCILYFSKKKVFFPQQLFQIFLAGRKSFAFLVAVNNAMSL